MNTQRDFLAPSYHWGMNEWILDSPFFFFSLRFARTHGWDRISLQCFWRQCREEDATPLSFWMEQCIPEGLSRNSGQFARKETEKMEPDYSAGGVIQKMERRFCEMQKFVVWSWNWRWMNFKSCSISWFWFPSLGLHSLESCASKPFVQMRLLPFFPHAKITLLPPLPFFFSRPIDFTLIPKDIWQVWYEGEKIKFIFWFLFRSLDPRLHSMQQKSKERKKKKKGEILEDRTWLEEKKRGKKERKDRKKEERKAREYNWEGRKGQKELTPPHKRQQQKKKRHHANKFPLPVHHYHHHVHFLCS